MSRSRDVAGFRCNVLALGVLSLAFGSQPTKASSLDSFKIADVGLTERVVIDHISGVAIQGYDPVAYFTDGAARIGKPDFEVVWHGAAWRFANEGNMAAFLADPQVYAPQFGGYDANAVARGIATDGDPLLYVLTDGRIFLFRDARSRAEFVAAPDHVEASIAAWPKLEKTLIE